MVALYFFGLVDRSLCNAYVAYSKLETQSCNLLSFRRCVTQPLITLGKPPQVGRPIPIACNQVTAKKRRKSNFSVPASICTENVGIHWVFMTKNKEDMKYVPERKLKRSLISNALPAKYIYVQIIKKVFQ